MKIISLLICLLVLYALCVSLYSLISHKTIAESATIIRGYIKKFIQDFFKEPEVELLNDPILLNQLVAALEPYNLLKIHMDGGYSYYGADKLPAVYVRVISKNFAEDWPVMQSIVANVFSAYMVNCGYVNVPFEVSYQENALPEYCVYVLYGTTLGNREKVTRYRSLQTTASRKAAVQAAKPPIDNELEEELMEEELRNVSADADSQK